MEENTTFGFYSHKYAIKIAGVWTSWIKIKQLLKGLVDDQL